MKKIFIAFTGPKIDQRTKIFRIAENFECWNLNKFTLGDFVKSIKKEIPPRNKNVLNNYKLPKKSRSPWGLKDDHFKDCSWGLLLPDNVPDSCVNGYAEIIFLLNLFASHFLYPVFYVTDFGVSRLPKGKDPFIYFHDQNQSKFFKSKNFVKFFDLLLLRSVYGSWYRDRAKKWDKEDWRLFVACSLFRDLKRYENQKSSMWQREAADMSTILEALFTAGDTTNEEVGYRLRKRIAVLSAFYFKDIETEVKKLYKQRCKFIHGDFYSEFFEAAKDDDSVSALPMPDFQFLYGQKEYVRFLLIGYLYIGKILKEKPRYFGDVNKVIQLLEQAIIDINLRNKIVKNLKAVYKLVPIGISL